MMRTFKIYSLNNFQMCSTVSLTIVIMLYISMTYLLNNQKSVSFTHFSPSSPTSPPHYISAPHHPMSLATTNLFSVSISSFCFSFFDSTYKWDHTMFVFLWLILLRIMPSSPIHVVAQAGFPSFYDWIIFHCMYRPHLLYPFISQRTFRLCPRLGYCE